MFPRARWLRDGRVTVRQRQQQQSSCLLPHSNCMEATASSPDPAAVQLVTLLTGSGGRTHQYILIEVHKARA